jgi:uncharacterized FAD-dependent dehydrogenase
MNTFDIGIIGSGIAGTFAAYKIAKEHKNLKVVLFDLGRPPAKRRRQLEGFFGVLPNSDGKFYLNDVEKVSNIIGSRKANAGAKSVSKVLKNIFDYKIIKDKSPSVSMLKKIDKFGYNLALNDHVQIYPKEIHALSKFVAEGLESAQNITFNFDDEVKEITKQKNIFHVQTETKEIKCKKILVAVGRSGWRWASDLYSKFGIIESNNIARYGIRIELPSSSVKDFNKSNCTLLQGNDLEIGPFSWYGTVIPEDHVDLAISAFRSNENRWKSDKVSFTFIGNRLVDNNGFEQTDRIGKLTFVLSNDRIVKEKVSSIIANKSKISIIKEYNWLSEELQKLSNVIPDVLTKAYFHVPTILPLIPEINIGEDLSTEIPGLYVAGESAGITGILAAAITGTVAGAEMCK